jgi:histidinol-phosphate/aromatic aminotransferase/cobyric acid decarboxylase-like protein
VAAIMALKDEKYYQKKYAETHALRRGLEQELFRVGIAEVVEGVGNFLLFYLPLQIQVRPFLQLCKEEKLYLRDVSNMGKSLGKNAVRIAVKDEKTNNKMVFIIRNVLEKLKEINS